MRDALIEVIPGLFLVPGEGDGRFPFAHSLLVEGQGRALIDAGAGIERLRRLRQPPAPLALACRASVRAGARGPERSGGLRNHIPLDMVIASHSHPDHTAGDWLFDGLPLYAPAQAADTFGRLELLSERFTEPGPLAATWRHYVSQHMGFRDAPPTHTYGGCVSVQSAAADCATFDFGQVRLVALHTPGHVVDHTCFFEPTHGVLLAFDIDLTSFGPWYGHRESDIEGFKASVRRVMDLQPRVVVSSHKGIIRDEIPERLARFLAVFDEREAKVRELLAAGYSLEEMVALSPFYGGHPYVPELMRYWEEQMIRKHVERCLGAS
jgi:ribonuclease/clavin/mitogillin